MNKYSVTGMSCAACVARVENAVNQIEGIESCSVSLLTNSMVVEGSVSSSEIVAAVEKAGYKASPMSNNSDGETGTAKSAGSISVSDEDFKDTATAAMVKRLVSSVCLLIPLMYVSMGHMMWGFRVPAFLDHNHIGLALVELILTTIIIVINRHFFISGIRGVMHKAPSMDTLVALGSGVGYIYSIIQLFIMTGQTDMMEQMDTLMELNFESSATILTLITVGKTLEAYSKGKTTDALKSLMKLQPKTAIILVNGQEKKVDIDQVKVGDILIIKSGENIPVDGIVIEGVAAVNEAALTGESVPVDKRPGDHVSCATINTNGSLKVKASAVGGDTTLSKIIEMVYDASATKAPVARVADKVAGIFVPVVLAIALITFTIWMIVQGEISAALVRAITVLVISCPCALGLATPVAIMVGNGVAARNGILFKNAVALENCGRAKTVVLDKTGTITKGEPAVQQMFTAEGVSENELMTVAFSLEKGSNHPLAKAICKHARKSGVSVSKVSNFEEVPGVGVSGEINGDFCQGGSDKITENVSNRDECDSLLEQTEGYTRLCFVRADRLLGIVTVADEIKEDSKEAIEKLKSHGIRTVMLTGDNQSTAEAIAKEAGVDEVIAEVRPDEKAEHIVRLKENNKVIMVGDGINDAIALTAADVGVAIGAGSDVAIDAADVVLINNSLMDLVNALHISKKTLKNIYENLFWAFIYNVIGIPLAAGFWIPITGWTLSPMFGAFAMSMSSICVVSNALRLNLIKVNKKIYKEERKTMNTYTVGVEGMMCPNCERHMREAIEKAFSVESVTASHEAKEVVVVTDEEISAEAFEAVVKEVGYTFTGLK